MPDPYWADVVFLGGFEGASPTDESPLSQTVTAWGGTVTSATEAKFGTKSLRPVESVGEAGISTPDNAAMHIAGQDFTIEGWINFSALMPGTGTFASQYDDVNQASWKLELLDTGVDTFAMRLTASELPDFSGGADSVTASSFTYALDTWYHIACDFDGTKYRLYVDGVMLGSEAGPWFDFANCTAPLGIATAFSNGFPTNYLTDVYLDEVRITVGAARYADDAGFTPPIAAFDRVEIFDDVLTDTVRVFAFADVVLAVTRTLTDNVLTTETLAATAGKILRETITFSEQHIPAVSYQTFLTDTAELLDQVLVGLPVTSTDALAVAATLQVVQALQVVEDLGLTDSLVGGGIYNLRVADSWRIAAGLEQFFHAEALDALAFLATPVATTLGYPTLSDSVALAQSMTPQWMLRVTATDEIEIAPSEALQMLLAGSLSEAIEISAGYIAPDGSFTAWAMNTRTGAVSEYDNFEFNSFARVGNKYLGASASGLYELLGDNDDGDDIVATLRGGYLQFAGTRLSRLKAAYIAMTGADTAVLKIDTKDGVSYTYSVDTRTGRSTKVHMGKGQRSRYFAWELTTVGQDFDLDTLEFVPVRVERRV